MALPLPSAANHGLPEGEGRLIGCWKMTQTSLSSRVSVLGSVKSPFLILNVEVCLFCAHSRHCSVTVWHIWRDSVTNVTRWVEAWTTLGHLMINDSFCQAQHWNILALHAHFIGLILSTANLLEQLLKTLWSACFNFFVSLQFIHLNICNYSSTSYTWTEQKMQLYSSSKIKLFIYIWEIVCQVVFPNLVWNVTSGDRWIMALEATKLASTSTADMSGPGGRGGRSAPGLPNSGFQKYWDSKICFVQFTFDTERAQGL